ncbi:S41 family peptidase [Paenibacillus chitinolyticus]|uniref:S41 family peptidase n=1 Tax=Paenibacillus chitinolyticus TaxID=79263 RepID=UPI0035DBE051
MGFPGIRKLKTAVAAIVVFGAVIPASAWAQESARTTDEVRQVLGQYHVSGITTDELKGLSIADMLKKINAKDPYTTYFTKEQLEKFTDSLENNYYGIGAQMGYDETGVYADKIFEGSPAEKDGLKKGDYILKVAGVSTQGKNLSEVVSGVLGPEGTKIELTVKRDGKELNLTLTRAKIHLPNVEGYLITPSTGYIKIDSFSSDADEIFDATLSALQKMGMKSLVIDLRDNPGGLVESAQNIASNFIKEGVFAHTKNRNNEDTPLQIKGGSTQNIPVFMLLNENSASASEMLAGALRDYGVAEVIGMKSYGKGSMQSLHSLSDESAVKVTFEEYLTPKMKPVNGIGIAPDIESDGYTAQLITALRKAGTNSFQVRVTKHDVTVNQVEVTEPYRPIREGGNVFVASRTLAALIGADIKWNQVAQAVNITTGKGIHTFAMSPDTLLLKNGTSYINLDKFDDIYPQLHWEDADNLLQLETEKE